jgi:hypothetical protein
MVEIYRRVVCLVLCTCVWCLYILLSHTGQFELIVNNNREDYRVPVSLIAKVCIVQWLLQFAYIHAFPSLPSPLYLHQTSHHILQAHPPT